MINCNYIGGQNDDEYNRFITIANEKNGNRKRYLLGVQNRILNCYQTYLNDFETLQITQGSTFNNSEANEKEALNHCYLSRTNTFKLKRGEIFNSQSRQIKAFCPYCLLNKPKTLDHYIGQTEYPEYSTLIKNLIPCCYDCNQKKNEKWRSNNRRRYIHFYNDSFLNERFLFAKLLFNDNDIPAIDYELVRPQNLTIVEFEIINSHFKDLNLIEEYIERSNAILSTELQIIQNSHNRGHTIESIRQTVIDRYQNIEGFGVNYWLKCMYEAIAQNIENLILFDI